MASYEKEKGQTGSPTCKPRTINDPVDFEELPEIPQTQATGNTSYSYHVLVRYNLIDHISEQLPGFDLDAGRTW